MKRLLFPPIVLFQPEIAFKLTLTECKFYLNSTVRTYLILIRGTEDKFIFTTLFYESEINLCKTRFRVVSGV